jgi:hypothetical protein
LNVSPSKKNMRFPHVDDEKKNEVHCFIKP